MKENLEIITRDIYESIHIEADSIMLNDVLYWHKKSHSKYSHFEVHKSADKRQSDGLSPIGVFVCYTGEETEFYIWDLSKRYLHEQSEKLIQFLADTIKDNQ